MFLNFADQLLRVPRVEFLPIFRKQVDFINELFYELVEVLVECPNLALCVLGESFSKDYVLHAISSHNDSL